MKSGKHGWVSSQFPSTRRMLVIVGTTLALSAAVLVFLALSVRVGPVRNSHNLTLARMMAVSAATQSFVADNGAPPSKDAEKFLGVLRGDHSGGTEKVYIEFSQRDLNAKGELIDGWDHPFVWDAVPPKGKFAIWSRGEKGKLKREEALEKGLYQVLIE